MLVAMASLTSHQIPIQQPLGSSNFLVVLSPVEDVPLYPWHESMGHIRIQEVGDRPLDQVDVQVLFTSPIKSIIVLSAG